MNDFQGFETSFQICLIDLRADLHIGLCLAKKILPQNCIYFFTMVYLIGIYIIRHNIKIGKNCFKDIGTQPPEQTVSKFL